MSKALELAGQRFGRLTAIERDRIHPTKHGWLWRCQCDCGKTVNVLAAFLKNGNSASCGCFFKERRKVGRLRHGHTADGKFSSAYSRWNGMLGRCYRPSNVEFHNYGGRGITVCERWKKFENFFADMGEPATGMTLERIRNNGNYEPGNVRWATTKEQARNRRNNVFVTIGSVTQTATDWAAQCGINVKTVLDRLHRGWAGQDAVMLPLMARFQRYAKPNRNL